MLLRKNKSFFIFLLLTISASVFAQPIKKDKHKNLYYEQIVPIKKKAPKKLILLYTADPHGDNVEENMPRIFHIKKQLANEQDAISISINGGDEPMDWPWAVSKHRGMYRLWAEWDAYGLGNHDIIHTDLSYLLSLVTDEKLKIIATNVISKKDQDHPFARYKILKYNGSKILIVSLLTQVVNKDSRVNKEVYVEKPSDSYNALLKTLQNEHNFDKIIAIYHAEYESFDGNEGLDDFLKKVNGKDLLILKAHEHEVKNITMIGKDGFPVPVLSGGTANNDVKEIVFYYNPKSETEVFSYGTVKDINIDERIEKDIWTRNFITTYKKANPLPPKFKWLEKVIFNNEFGFFSSDRKILNSKTIDPKDMLLEAPLTSFIGDAFRDQMNTNFALMEGTNIRKDIKPGPVTGMDILRALPNLNKLVFLEFTGFELEKVINDGLTKWDRRIFFSGLVVEYDDATASFKIREIYDTETGSFVKLEYNKVYKGTCIDHFVDPHDLSFKVSDKGQIDSHTVINYIRKLEKTGDNWELIYNNSPALKYNQLPEAVTTEVNKTYDGSQKALLETIQNINTEKIKLKSPETRPETSEEFAIAYGVLNSLFSRSNTLIQEIYNEAGVLYKIGNEDFGRGVGRITYIQILPEGVHYLNRFAKFFDRLGVKLIFSQKLLSEKGASALYSFPNKIFVMNYKTAALFEKNTDFSIHEMIHSFFCAMLEAGYDSKFIGFITSKDGRINPDYGKDYEKQLSVDELATYAENTASISRKLYKETLSFYREFIPELNDLDEILMSQLKDVSADADVSKRYQEIKELITIFFFSDESNYGETRAKKLSEKAKEYFGSDTQNYEKFIELFQESYSKWDVKTKLPKVNLSKYSQEDNTYLKVLLRPIVQRSSELASSLIFSVEVANKLNYALNRIATAMNTDCFQGFPEKGFDRAYKFTSGLVVQYKLGAGTQGNYYSLLFSYGNLNYETVINAKSMNNIAEAEILIAARAKLIEQIELVKNFGTKFTDLKTSLYSFPLLPTLQKRSPDDKEPDGFMNVEEHLKMLDVGILDLEEIFAQVLSFKEQATAIRADYRNNVSDNVKTWGDLIKQYPVKEAPSVTNDVSTGAPVITETEIKQANDILEGKSSGNSIKSDVILLMKLLKYSEEVGKSNAVTAVKLYLSNYKEYLDEGDLKFFNNVSDESFFTEESLLFNEKTFRAKIKYYVKVKPEEIDKYSTEKLVTKCFRRLVNAINTRWSTGHIPIPSLLSFEEVDLLVKDYGLLHYLKDRTNTLERGTEARRANLFCMETLVEIVSSSSTKNQSSLLTKNYTDLKTELKSLVEDEKIKDPVYREKYESKNYSKRFAMMKDIFKEAK